MVLDSAELELMHQRAILRVLVSMAMPCGILFGLINYSRGLYVLATCESLFSIGAILIWRSNETVKNPQLVIACFTVPIFAIVSYAIYLPTASVTMFVWVYTIPVLAYTALGTRVGLIITAIFYSSVALQYNFRFGDMDAFRDTAAILNIVVCSAAIWGFVHVYEKARAQSQAQFAILASTDPLTGLNNRLGLESIFERRQSSSEKEGLTMGLIMVDLDHFKSINDTYGHDCGDEVLRQVAISLENSVREGDSVFRLGGEEFCLLVPRMDRLQLQQTAESIRERVQNIEFSFDLKRVQVTCSIGAVMMAGSFSDLDKLLVEADKRLYVAKKSGRNRVVVDRTSQPLAA